MYAALSTQSPAAAGSSEYLAYTPPAGSTLVGGSLLVGLAANGYGYRAAATAAMFTPSYQYDASNVFLQCVPLGLASCQNGIPEYYGVVERPGQQGRQPVPRRRLRRPDRRHLLQRRRQPRRLLVGRRRMGAPAAVHQQPADRRTASPAAC